MFIKQRIIAVLLICLCLLACQKQQAPEETSVQVLLPKAFWGVWDTSLQECDEPHSNTRLEIRDNELYYWESSGRLENLTRHSEQTVQLSLRMTGEGEVWEKVAEFEVSEDQNTLTEIFKEEGIRFQRVRCTKSG